MTDITLNKLMGITASELLDRLLTVDGIGSGLDADLLDGQQGAFYQNASNLNAGTLAAARMPALTGDVTTVAGAVAATIANGAVTLAKMANLPANTFMGNNTGASAAPVAMTTAQAKTLLAMGISDVSGLQTALNGKLNTSGGSLSGPLTFDNGLTVVQATGGAKMYVGAAGMSLRFKPGSNDATTPNVQIAAFDAYDGTQRASFPENVAATLAWAYPALTLNGNAVWHAGNFDPSTKLAASSLIKNVTNAADLPSTYPLYPTIGQVNAGTGWSGAESGTIANFITDSAGNRAFQMYAPLKGGTNVPDYYLRTHHSTDGGGGWTGFVKMWHNGNLASPMTTDTVQTVTGAKTFGANVLIDNGGISDLQLNGTTFGVFGDATGARTVVYANAGYVSLRPNSRGTVTGEFKVDTTGFTWGGNVGWHAGNFNRRGVDESAAPLLADFDGLMGTNGGLFRFDNSTTTRPSGTDYGVGIWMPYSNVNGAVIAIDQNPGDTLKFRGLGSTGVWNPWYTVWHDGNFTPSSKMDTSWTLTAGNGLTGGGSGAANRTLTLGTPGTSGSDTANDVTATSHTHFIQTAFLYNDDDRTGTIRTTPDTYRDRGLSVAFNSGANLGISATYGMSLHIAPWTVYNAAYKQQQLVFRGDATEFYWRAATSDTTWGTLYKVHTDATTDINAATLGGAAPNSAASAGTIVQRNGSGYIYANFFNTSANVTAAAPTAVMVETSSDGFIRKQSLADLMTNAGAWTSGNFTPSNVPSQTATLAFTSGNGKGINFWASGQYALYMSSAPDATYGGRVAGETTSDYNMYFVMTGGTNRGFVWRNGATAVGGLDGAGNMRITGSFTGDDYIIGSDRRFKTDIRGFEYRGRLNPQNFTVLKTGKKDFGFIAQEVQRKYPEAVYRDEEGMLRLSMPKLVTVVSYQANQLEDNLVKTNKQVAKLAKENGKLKTEVKSLKTRLARLEKQVAKLAA